MQFLVRAYTEFIRLERGQASEERADYLSNFFGARDLYGAVKYLNKKHNQNVPDSQRIQPG
jgi:hypothetical protein